MHVVQIMYFNTHQIRNWGVKRLDKLGWFAILGKWSEVGEANWMNSLVVEYLAMGMYTNQERERVAGYPPSSKLK